MSHLDDDVGNRDEYLLAREEQGVSEVVVEHHDDHLSNHGKAGDSGEQTATEDGTQSPPPAEETIVTPANFAPEPSGGGTAPKKPANLLPMPFRKTSPCLQASTSRPNEPFSCVIVCLLDVCTTLSRVPPRSS